MYGLHMYKYPNILGRMVTVTIDRPLGSTHPDYPDHHYPINYGYVEGVIGGDGEEQDVYLLGVNTPISSYQAVVIAVIHRYNDCEEKWVAAPSNLVFSKHDIQKLTHFQEQFFDSEIFC